MIYRFVFSSLLSLIATLHSMDAAAQSCSNPEGIHGEIIYNSNYGVFTGCTPEGWAAFHVPACPDGDECDPCHSSNNPAPGATCNSGSIYAGLSPDGNVPMYTTPADAGQFTWNDGTETWLDTAMQNCTTVSPGAQASCQTGEANTALLAALGTTPSPAPYVAARHCDDLDAHGQTDWYLPSQDELNVLYENLVDQNGDNLPGGPLGSTFGFNVTGVYPAGWYWSSTETNSGGARPQRFNNGYQGNYAKNEGVSVRCVRK
jgi:hypothetical protein